MSIFQYLQGFSIQNLTPLKAAEVLYRCEQRMDKAIPDEDLTAGKLGQYLKPEDYHPIKQVNNFSDTFLIVVILQIPVPGLPQLLPHLPPFPWLPSPPAPLAHSFYPVFMKI